MKETEILSESDRLIALVQDIVDVANDYIAVITDTFEPSINLIAENWLGDNAVIYLERASTVDEKTMDIVNEMSKLVKEIPPDIQKWAEEEAKKSV